MAAPAEWAMDRPKRPYNPAGSQFRYAADTEPYEMADFEQFWEANRRRYLVTQESMILASSKAARNEIRRLTQGARWRNTRATNLAIAQIRGV
jgi:hypothetical protein